ncbi:hypothetical protein GW626_09895 [Peribacillus muralis]|uniref:hypothetical protein n=1 Tax=Peribacillus muralis TaxID=264697 RepID=UPI001F4E93CC|nr:hypothetical protein [Peribacillus muralis]MCK1993623.1 hypothetical protein [Peribacillus muralis]MCK2014089.1 hypothetical protein [Peribacillus muralis]
MQLRIKTEWIGTEGATLLREMRVNLRRPRLKAEKAQGPPLDKGAPAVEVTGEGKAFLNFGLLGLQLRIKTEWIGTEGATLLREMRVILRHRRLKAEEAQGPPAERERLQWKGTVKHNFSIRHIILAFM